MPRVRSEEGRQTAGAVLRGRPALALGLAAGFFAVLAVVEVFLGAAAFLVVALVSEAF